MKRLIIKTMVFLCLSLIAFRFAAIYYLEFEAAIFRWVEEQRIIYVAQAATEIGYVPANITAKEELNLDDIIEREALRYKFSPALIRAIIKQESDYNSQAVSPAGAIGLMGVMPSNATFCGMRVDELYNPYANVICGAKILGNAWQKYQNNIIATLGYYNGGERCFGKRAENPCKETALYPKQVLSRLATDLRG